MDLLIGEKLIKQKEFGKALNIFTKLEKNNIKDKRIFFYLGIIYFELNNIHKSIRYYEKYLKEDPNSIITLHRLAAAKQSIGEIEAAKNIYLRLIKIDKYKIRSYYGILMLDENLLTKENFETIHEIEKNQSLNLHEKGIVNFILSKKEKKNNNYKKEIEYLKNFHLNIFNSNYSFNMSSQFYYNEIISQNYNKISIVNKKEIHKKDDHPSPIFIIGLPRSGSTLVESILTSGVDKVDSSGESHVFNMAILEQIGPKIYNKDFDKKNFLFEIELSLLKETISQRYSAFNINYKTKNRFFIDKSLENFFNIELILNIFPDAKFLHTFRDPIDSIISIYQSMLAELSWTHKIEDILNYIDIYYKVIAYFKAKYPEKIMDINLKKFTEESDLTAKKIYNFCNLNWSNEVLNFYKRNNLHSKTLSFAQIRKKISKYNDKKYKPYLYMLNDYSKKYDWINLD